MAEKTLYHIIEETVDGYRLVKSVVHDSTMRHNMRSGQPRWVIWCKRSTLTNFGSIGMPNGYHWDGYQFVTKTMPVRPLIAK